MIHVQRRVKQVHRIKSDGGDKGVPKWRADTQHDLHEVRDRADSPSRQEKIASANASVPNPGSSW